MSTFLSSILRKARKEYRCAACRAMIEPGLRHFIQTVSFTERKAIVCARNDNWRIMPGTTYEDYRGVSDGTAYTLRMRPEISALVSKYDWWPE